MLPALEATLEDRRLSRSERRSLKEVFADLELDESGRRELRNLAFRLAEEQLRSRSDQQLLGWLHDVVKALDATVLSAQAERAPLEQAFFSPGPDCARRIGRLVDEARERLDICVFTITDDAISSRLVAAGRRGLAVRIVTDDAKSEDRGSDVERLVAAGLAVRTDRSEAHMHHKYAPLPASITSASRPPQVLQN